MLESARHAEHSQPYLPPATLDCFAAVTKHSAWSRNKSAATRACGERVRALDLARTRFQWWSRLPDGTTSCLTIEILLYYRQTIAVRFTGSQYSGGDGGAPAELEIMDPNEPIQRERSGFDVRLRSTLEAEQAHHGPTLQHQGVMHA